MDAKNNDHVLHIVRGGGPQVIRSSSQTATRLFSPFLLVVHLHLNFLLPNVTRRINPPLRRSASRGEHKHSTAMLRPLNQRSHLRGVDPVVDDGDAGALRKDEEEEGGATGGFASNDDEKPDMANNQEQQLRLNVFREFLCSDRPASSPRYYEARPKHFPPELDAFLTGALYVSIHRAAVAFFPSYNAVYGLPFAFTMGACIFALWGDLFQATEDGKHRFNYAGYAMYAACAYVLVTTVSCYTTRPAVRRFHERMEAVVQEMAPLFRRAGYDLQYHRREPIVESASLWTRLLAICFRESFVRIVPFKGELTQEDAAKAAALWDPQRRSAGDPVAAAVAAGPAQPAVGEEFRVAVYGAQAYTGQEGLGREHNFVMVRSFLQLCGRVDECSWGAVSTEMRPYTDRYNQTRNWYWLAGMVTYTLLTLTPDAFDSRNVFAPYIVLVGFLFVFLLYPNAWEARWLARVGVTPKSDEIRATLERLSPVVEDRSGYRLRLDIEPEGCLGGTCAYVSFVPCCGSAAPANLASSV
jgi:hypothetical protein